MPLQVHLKRKTKFKQQYQKEEKNQVGSTSYAKNPLILISSCLFVVKHLRPIAYYFFLFITFSTISSCSQEQKLMAQVYVSIVENELISQQISKSILLSSRTASMEAIGKVMSNVYLMLYEDYLNNQGYNLHILNLFLSKEKFK